MVHLWIPLIWPDLLGRSRVRAGQVVGQGDIHPDRHARGNQWGDLPGLAPFRPRIALHPRSISQFLDSFRFLINNPSALGLGRLPVRSTFEEFACAF